MLVLGKSTMALCAPKRPSPSTSTRACTSSANKFLPPVWPDTQLLGGAFCVHTCALARLCIPRLLCAGGAVGNSRPWVARERSSLKADEKVNLKRCIAPQLEILWVGNLRNSVDQFDPTSLSHDSYPMTFIAQFHGADNFGTVRGVYPIGGNVRPDDQEVNFL